MPEYRCYFLDHRHYVVASASINHETDDEARTVAQDLLRTSPHRAIEVWQGKRLVHEARKTTTT
jgi:hypothetical protein